MFHWTIDKFVQPETWDLFRGDSGTSRYTIAVTKDAGTEEAWVEGRVCVANRGPVATANLSIVVVLDSGYSLPSLASAAVDVSNNPMLDPRETGCYNYRVNIPISGGALPQPRAGGLYRVTANIQATNCCGTSRQPLCPSPSATTRFPGYPLKMKDTIHVDDSNRGWWTFNQSGFISYDKTFTCDRSAGTHNNRATIRETGQSDSASVTVNCYALRVRKDAWRSRIYHWTIDKQADQSALTLELGQPFLVNYSLTLDATFTDSNGDVSGNIWIENPAPVKKLNAKLLAVSDVVSGVGAASIKCQRSFPTVLENGQTLNCTYTANLPDASRRMNTATVTLQNCSLDYQKNATETGTTDFSGSALIDLSVAPINDVDECVDFKDSNGIEFRNICYPKIPIPSTFTYSRSIGPYDTCGSYTVENGVSFCTLDTETYGGDTWTITVDVPCPSAP
jgi:hypothetical protein